jgi:hypothetical protein
MKPQGAVLDEYTRDRNRISVIRGPLGSGKTIETCEKSFKLMCEQQPDNNNKRRTRFYAVRNTYSDLLGTTVKDWLAIYGELGQYKAGGLSSPTHTLDFFLEDGTRVESEMVFLALDRPADVRKLRGTQPTGFWLNELKELSYEVVMMADGRVGRYPSYKDGGVEPTWCGIVADTNSPDTDHWLYRLMEEDKPEGWAFFHQPGGVVRQGRKQNGRVNWVVNPDAENIQNLPDGYYSRLGGKTDDWIAVNYANEYGAVFDGKAVYPEYNDNLHCMEFDFIPDVPIYRGWDFGTAACALVQYTPKGRLIVKREFTATQTMGIDRFADHVLNECATLKDYRFIDVGDPSGDNKSLGREGETCFTILKDKGIDIEPGPTQNVKLRHESVRHFLDRLIEGRPAFILHPDCKVTRKGFQGGYCFRRLQVSGEKYADVVDKHNPYSHIQDCISYITTFIRMGYEQPEEEWEVEGREGKSIVGGY